MKIAIDGGDPKGDFIFNLKDKWFVVSRENLEMNTDLYNDIMFDYGEVPIEDEEPDYESGGVSTSYDWENATLDTEGLLNAVGDHILRGDLGNHEEFGAGEHFVYPLTKELAEEIWDVDSPLIQHPAVQALIDYDEIKRKYQ